MPHHRVGPSSITVLSLLDENGVEHRAPGRSTRHRIESTAAERVKSAAGAAVAAGALIGTAAQVANASPLLPGTQDADEAVEAQSVALAAPAPVEEAEAQAAAPAPDAAAIPVSEEIALPPEPEPVAAPFGLQNLPPEVSGPLGQAEQALKEAQQQFLPPPPAVRPVAGAISSNYGTRWGSMHSGVDFADQLGAPIHAVSGGNVVEAGPASGFGQWVRVLHDDGTTGVYGHVNDMYVQQGQRVDTGDVIATVGNRGQSSGPHLHLEIWDQGGNKMDPSPWMAAKGVPLEWGPTS